MYGFGAAQDVDSATEKKKPETTSTGSALTQAVLSPLSTAAAPLCDGACGDAKSKDQQKDYINGQNPLTGDAAADARIQQIRDQQFQAWQKADDVQKFDKLPADMQNLLPAAKQLMDAVAAKIPPQDMNLTLLEAAKKYPDLAQQVWASIQQAFPSLKGMPLDYALALAQSSGLGNMKLSDIKKRIDDLYAARGAGVASGAGGMGVGTMAAIGVGAVALIFGIAAVVKKKKAKS